MHDATEKKNSLDTESLILMAAEEEFMNKGFLGARTSSIAEAAGVTHAMLHYYFRTKEKLFETIISRKIELLKRAVLGSVVSREDSLDDIIRNLINRHLDFIAENPELPRFIIGEIYSNPQRSAIFLDAIKNNAPYFLSFLQEKINNEARAGKVRKIEAKMLLLDILSLNIFPYMAAPAVNAAFDGCMEDPEKFLQRRKQDILDTIMMKLHGEVC